MSDRKIYLGDGAYADINEFGDLELTTENGIAIQNIVVIEPEIYPVLEQYIKDVRAQNIGRWRK